MVNGMARQEGLILLTGPVGNLSFYRTRDGYFVRRKSGVSRNRIMNDAAYARTRENIAEFRRASMGAKLLRSAFRPWCDNRLSGRLTGTMIRVVQSDAFNARGERRISHGNCASLTGFEFNRDRHLKQIVPLHFIPSVDRVTGVMRIHVPAFTPEKMLKAPGGATHLRLKAVGAVFDFEGNTCETATSQTVDIPIEGAAQEPFTLTLAVAPGSTYPMFLVLGVEFLQAVNGTLYPLHDRGLNAMAIVAVQSGQQLPPRDPRSLKKSRREYALLGTPALRPTRHGAVSAPSVRHQLLADDHRSCRTVSNRSLSLWRRSVAIHSCKTERTCLASTGSATEGTVTHAWLALPRERSP